MYVYLCVCVNVCVFVWVCVCLLVFACVCLCRRACVYLFMTLYAFVCLYACVYGCVCMLVSVFLHAFMGVCVYKDRVLYSQNCNFPKASWWCSVSKLRLTEFQISFPDFQIELCEGHLYNDYFLSVIIYLFCFYTLYFDIRILIDSPRRPAVFPKSELKQQKFLEEYSVFDSTNICRNTFYVAEWNERLSLATHQRHCYTICS